MPEKLTKEDRSNPRKIAAIFAQRMFRGPSLWIRDGKMTGVTEDMLTHLLAEVYSIGYDSGVVDAGETIISALRARGDAPGAELAEALEKVRKSCQKP